MKTISYFFLLIQILIFLGCNPGPSLRLPPDQIDLQGHRGARGLKPENTWPAFESAIQFEMTTLELDTVLTKDGYVIVHHDSATNPLICQKANGEAIGVTNLYELNLADLKQLDCGSKRHPDFPEQIPVPGTKLITLREFFQKVKEYESGPGRNAPKLMFNIETKFPNDDRSGVSTDILQKHVRGLIEEAEKAKMVERTTLQSFYLPALKESKLVNPKIRRSALFAPSYPQGIAMLIGLGSGIRSDILAKAREYEANIISPYFLYVNESFIAQSRAQNLKVIPWTVNDPKKMRALMEIGVDGIISDYPDRLRSVYLEYKNDYTPVR
jgi:glycerophosphoryl diester phosphodiesterase